MTANGLKFFALRRSSERHPIRRAWRAVSALMGVAVIALATGSAIADDFMITGATTVNEGNSVTWQITRSGGTAGSLTVYVTSSVPTVASVSSPLIFIGGSATANLQVNGVDGSGSATISLSATGYTYTTRGIDVENVDPRITYTNVPASGTTGDSLTFQIRADDVVGDRPLNVVWDFKDGTILVGSNQTHTYTAANIYYVTVTVTDGDGGQSQYVYPLTISAKALTLTGNQTENEGVNTLTWTVIRNGSTASNATINLNSSNPSWASVPATVTILAGSDRTTFNVNCLDGTHDVTITASAGGFSSANRTLNVVNVAPVVSTPSIPSSGNVGVPLTFSITATDVAADPLGINNYYWTFGDGGSAYGPTSTYTYGHSGTFLVTINVFDKDGGQTIRQQQIIISRGPQLTVNVITAGLPGLGNGTITLDPPNVYSNYPLGTVVKITAIPNPGSYFYKWGGDAPEGGTPNPIYNNPLYVTMDEDKTITLMFSIAYTNGPGPDVGTEIGDVDQDGLPDKWELQYELDPEDSTGNNGGAGNADADIIPTVATAGAYPLAPRLRLLLGYCTGVPFRNYLEARGLDGIYGTNDDPGSKPNMEDTDGDTLPDGWEYYFWRWRSNNGLPGSANLAWVNFRPIVFDDAAADTDGEGLSDAEELQLCTDPTHADSDRDLMDDWWENDNNLNPLDPWDSQDIIYANPDADVMAKSIDIIRENVLTNVFYHHAVYTRTAPNMDPGANRFNPPTGWGTPQNADTAWYLNYDEYLGPDRQPEETWDADGLVINPVNSIDASDPNSADGDGDGVPDGWEGYAGLNPNNPFDAGVDDADGDKLPGTVEWANAGDPIGQTAMGTWTNKPSPTDPGIGLPTWAWRNAWIDLNTNGYYDEGEPRLWGDHPAGWTTPTGKWGAVATDLNLVKAGVPAPVEYWGEDPIICRRVGTSVWAWVDRDWDGVYTAGFDLPSPLTLTPTGGMVANLTYLILYYHNDPHPQDTDFDGLPDGPLGDPADSEQSMNCNPTAWDTDGDFLPDGWEVYAHSDPTVMDASENYRKDETIDVDPDGDGLINAREYWTGTVFEWNHVDPRWADCPGTDLGAPRMATRKGMYFDKPIFWAREFFLPPDFASCPSFMVADWQTAAGSLYYNNYHTTWCDDPDTDVDGMDDFWEVYHGLNPCKGCIDLMDPFVFPDGLRLLGGGASAGIWDADPATVPYFEMGLDLGFIVIPYYDTASLVADINGWWALDQVGPFNFGLELMDEDADGLPNLEEYSYEDSFFGRSFYHTDPSSYNRTDMYGNDDGQGNLYGFVQWNYNRGEPNTYDNGWHLWLVFSNAGSAIGPFPFEMNEGFDTDNDGIGDAEELARIPSLNSVGNTDPLDSTSPMENRAARFHRNSSVSTSVTEEVTYTNWTEVITNETEVITNYYFEAYTNYLTNVTVNSDFLRTYGAWVFLAPQNYLTRYTVEAWVDPADMESEEVYQVVLDRAIPIPNMWGGTLTRSNFRIGIDTATRSAFILYNGRGAWDTTVVSAGPYRRMVSNEWAHVAGTYNGTNLTIYINGEQVNSVASQIIPATGIFTMPHGGFFRSGTTMVGAREDSTAGALVPELTLSLIPIPVDDLDHFDGWIDEVRVWNGARTQVSIQANMRKKLTRTATENDGAITLEHYLSFDDNPDPDASWKNAVPEPVVPTWLAYMQGSNLPMHQTQYMWNRTPQKSRVYSGSVQQPYNYIVFAKDLRQHAAVNPPEDDYYHVSYYPYIDEFGKTNMIPVLPEDYPNSANPYYALGVYDFLYMNGAVADGDVFSSGSWMTGEPMPDPDDFDTDGDGMPDWWEIENALDPNDASGVNGADGDPDGDGLTNYYEYLAGTNPQRTDSNGDGIRDGLDDRDHDGLNNLTEQSYETLPNIADTDDDGLTDGEEVTGTDNIGGTVTPTVPKGLSDPINSLDPIAQRSMSFDGNGRLIVPPQDKFMANAWTLEMWVRPAASGNGGTLIERFVSDTLTGETAVNYEMGVGAPAGGMVRAYVSYTTKSNETVRVDGAQPTDILAAPGCDALIPIDQWTHLASTYDHETHRLELYVNGELRVYRIDATPEPQMSFGPGTTHRGDDVTIGAARSTGAIVNGFEGLIDEIKFYDRARTAEQIADRYNAPPASSGSGSAFTIPYKTGWVQPGTGMSPDLAAVPAGQQVHAIVQFNGRASSNAIAAVNAAGVQVVNRVSPMAVTVCGTRQQIGQLANVRWSGLIGADKKIAPELSKAATGAEQAALALFFAGTPASNAVAAVLAAGAHAYDPGYLGGTYMVVGGTPAQMQALAAADSVAWIAPAATWLVTRDRPFRLLDTPAPGHLEAAPYTTVGEGWDGPGLGSADLYYFFMNGYPGLPGDQEEVATVEQMWKWSEYAAITWTLGVFDMDFSSDIGWIGIDGPYGILAFAYYPNDINPETIAGDMYFDIDEDWNLGADIDLNYVALHELGHVLGVGHSDDPTAIMYPYYASGAPAVLQPDDIAAIQSLYALPDRPRASFRFDDGGTTAEDFTAARDWEAVPWFKHAATLDGTAAFSTNAAPMNADSDNDGMPDWWEATYGLDMLSNSDAGLDGDEDGLINLNEYRAGTSPLVTDTDRDGTSDYYEDPDDDKLPSGLEQDVYGSDPGQKDTDDDTLNDDVEAGQGTDPASSISPFVFRALHFDGTGVVTVADRVLGKFSDRFAMTNWTVECMVRPQTLPTGSVSLVSRQIDCSGIYTFDVGLSNGYPYVRYNGDHSVVEMRIQRGQPLPVGVWTHLAGRYSDGVLSLFVNGKRVESSNTDILPARGHGDVHFGALQFIGELKEIRLWNVGRSDNDIATYKDRTLFFDRSATDPGLLRLNGDGTLRESAFTVDPVTLRFVDQLEYWTLECWVKTTDSGALIARWNANGFDELNDFNYYLGVQDNGRAIGRFAAAWTELTIENEGQTNETRTYTYVINTTVNNIYGAYPINDGQWHHVAYVRDQTNAIIYVDGELDAKQDSFYVTLPPPNTYILDPHVRILDGPVVLGNHLTGDMDETRIWNRGLSFKEVSVYGHENLVGDEPGLVTYFNFDYQLGVHADERATMRDPILEYGRYIPDAKRVRTNFGPPIEIYPLRIYKGIAMSGYFSADDGGGTLEDYLYALNWAYAGILNEHVNFITLTQDEVPFIGDSDGDGMPDSWETLHGLNQGSADGVDGAAGDPDGDGLINIVEYTCGTDPRSVDTDHDGVLDIDEDSDGDHLTNGEELSLGTNPANPDTDDDGWSDSMELDPLIIKSDGRRITSPVYSCSPVVPRSMAMKGVPVIVPSSLKGSDDDRFDVGNWTVETWVRLEGTNENGTIIGHYTSAGHTNFELRIDHNIPRIMFSTMGGQIVAAGGTGTLPSNTWVHLAGVFNSTNYTLDIYINGTGYRSQVDLLSPARGSGYTIASDGLYGNLDEIRIWHEALTATQLQENRDRILNTPSLQSGLIANYRFDDGQNVSLTNKVNGLVNRYGAEDFVHRLDWRYAITNIVFDPDLCVYLDGIDDFNNNDIPDWWEGLFFGYDPAGELGIGISTGSVSEAVGAYPNGWRQVTAPITDSDGVFGAPPAYAFLLKDFYIDLPVNELTVLGVSLSNSLLSVYRIDYTMVEREAGVYSTWFYDSDSGGPGSTPHVNGVGGGYLYPGRNRAYREFSGFYESLQPGFNRIAIAVYNYSGGNNSYDLYLRIDGMWIDTPELGRIWIPMNNVVIPFGSKWMTYGDLNQLDPPPVSADGDAWWYSYYGLTPQERDAAINYNPAAPLVTTPTGGEGVTLEIATDSDQDGLSDYYEYWADTNPKSADTDNDGWLDTEEDSDHDGLQNREEQIMGTDPRLIDTDDDGISDFAETTSYTDPVNSLSPLTNRVLSLPGDNGSYVRMPNEARFAFASNLKWTIEAWINPMVYGGTIFERTVDEGVYNYYLRLGVNGRLIFGFTPGDRTTNVEITSTRSIPTGQWSHVSAIYSVSNGLLRIRIDGKPRGELTTGKLPASSGISPANTLIGRSFNGNIDEVRFWGFDPGYRTNTLADTLLFSESNLVSYLRFDDGTSYSNGLCGTSCKSNWWWGQVEDFAPGFYTDWLTRWSHAGTLVGGANIIASPADSPVSVALYFMDSDLDGMPDYWEIQYGLSPYSAEGEEGADGDPDNDGLINLYEYLAGTNPRLADSNEDGTRDEFDDSDQDSLSNASELLYGTNPGNRDTDDDTLSDGNEILGRTDPISSICPYVIRALHFSGCSSTANTVVVTDKIEGKYTDRLDMNTWTIECLVRPTSLPGSGIYWPLISRIAEQEDDQKNINYEIGLMSNGRAYVRFTAHGSVTNIVVSSGQVATPGMWTHLAGRFENGMLSLLVDGEMSGSTLVSADCSHGHGDLVIGSADFAGDLKEIRIWKIARSNLLINEFRNRSLFFGTAAAKAGYLNVGGNGHLKETATTYSGGMPVDMLVNAWTLEAWIKTTSSGMIIARRNTSETTSFDFNYYLGVDQDGTLLGRFSVYGRFFPSSYYYYGYGYDPYYYGYYGSYYYGYYDPYYYSYWWWPFDADYSANKVKGEIKVNDGQWHHVAYVHDSVKSSLYVDGILDVSQAGLITPTLWATWLAGTNQITYTRNYRFALVVRASEGPLVIGENLVGNIDEARVWNRALSRAELNTVNKGDLLGTELGLVSYFSFDNQIGPFANERASIRNPEEEYGLYINDAHRIEDFLNGPPIKLNPLNSYSRVALSAYFSADDGGIRLEDFTQREGQFPFKGWAYAGVLGGCVSFTNLADAEIPITTDSDADGMPDWWETKFGLDPGDANGDEGAWADIDYDGMNNLAEFRARTDPWDADTDSNGFTDFYSWSNGTFRIFGERFTDFDRTDDDWEDAYDLDPGTFDSHLDSDLDGWDNLSEFMACVDPDTCEYAADVGTHPFDPYLYPRPQVTFTFKYAGINNGPNIRVTAYHAATMDGLPDAELVVANVPDPVPADGFSFTTNRFTLGYLRQGPCWFFAWFDLNNDQTWEAGEPAGIAQYQPIDIQWGTVGPIEIGLTDKLPGYERFSWLAVDDAANYTVLIRNLSQMGSPTIFARTVMPPRTWIHEGDYLTYGYNSGLPNATLQWFIYTTGAVAIASSSPFYNTYPPSQPAPTPVTPQGAILRFARETLEWSMDQSNTMFELQISPSATFVPLLADIFTNVPFREVNGMYRYTLPIYAGDGNFTNGVYYWQVRGYNPRMFFSGFSPTRSFRISLDDLEVAPYSISGDLRYFGKVSNAVNYIVQAFSSPGFGWLPEAQISVPNSVNTNEWPVNEIPFALRGLHAGTYYVRAFLDQNGNKKWDIWESFGYIEKCFYAPQAVAVPSSAFNKKLPVLFRDTDQDKLPDDWEYQYFTNLFVAGPGPVRGYTDSNNDGVNDYEMYALGPLNHNPLDPLAAGADGIPFAIKNAFGMDLWNPYAFYVTQIAFGGLPLEIFKWSPVPGATVATANDGSATLSKAGTTAKLKYQVQYSLDFASWYNVPAGNPVTYDAGNNILTAAVNAPLSPAVYYRVKFTWTP